MTPGEVLVEVRRRTGVSRRELAERAGTSAATLVAYESGRVQPSVPVLERIVGAIGFDVVLQPRARHFDPVARGDELVSALRLAAQFPARQPKAWRAPVFPRR